MSDAGNPLGIREIDDVVYIPLEVISEEEVERLRQEHVPNTIDSTADELGPSAPGVKDDADERIEALQKQSLKQIDTDKPVSPADALG